MAGCWPEVASLGIILMGKSSTVGVTLGAMSEDLVATIRTNRKSGIPTLVLGPPGVGKSQQVHQAADGDPVVDVRLSMLDPVDLRGLPMVHNGTVQWARPDFLPSDGTGILLFDELNTAPVAVQNAALQLILDRRCGPHKLGDGWYIVACGNRSSHRAHVNPISAPLRNRFAIVDYVPSVPRWTRWALTHDVHADVISFLNFSNEYLTTDPSDDYANFASPRSWERVSIMLKDEVSDLETFTSLVGRGAAVAFEAYRKEIASLPDIDALLDGKATWTHDKSRISITYAIAMALASRLISASQRGAPSASHVDCAASIATTMPPEIAVLFFTACDLGPPPLAHAIRLAPSLTAFFKSHAALLRKYGRPAHELLDEMATSRRRK